LQLISSSLLIIVLINPVSPALASESNRPISAQETVTASAVIVPTHVAELGFLISGIAREVPVREGDFVKAGQTLIVVDTPELEFAVIEAQAALRSVQSYADLQKYRRIKNRRNGKIFYDVIPAVYRQRADARVQQAQVILELAQINLAEGTLTAPSDGIVTSLSVIPGGYVPSDQAVVTLATLNNLQVETTDLSERDITNVRVGAPVDIFIGALNESFPGRVASISPRADTIGGDVVFKVTIAFDRQPEHVLWGMTAEVNIAEEK
jgi:RND family efflux transporter MFP subunit